MLQVEPRDNASLRGGGVHALDRFEGWPTARPARDGAHRNPAQRMSIVEAAQDVGSIVITARSAARCGAVPPFRWGDLLHTPTALQSTEDCSRQPVTGAAPCPVLHSDPDMRTTATGIAGWRTVLYARALMMSELSLPSRQQQQRRHPLSSHRANRATLLRRNTQLFRSRIASNDQPCQHGIDEPWQRGS